MSADQLSLYRFALLRTPWDYAEHPAEFAAFLTAMEAHNATHKSVLLLMIPQLCAGT